MLDISLVAPLRFLGAARAFGRRLQWTALVPFADCLNHGNVGVKYDYDVDGNGLFRMFPTGRNRYPKVWRVCAASLCAASAWKTGGG